MALVLAVAVAPVWYRQTGPRLHGDSFGVAGVVHVGETFNVGIDVWTGNETVKLTGVRLEEPAQAVVVGVKAQRSGPAVLGTLTGDPADEGYVLAPVIGRSVKGTPEKPLTLVVAITPSATGVYRYQDVRIRYGTGLRARTTNLAVSVCVNAVDRGLDLSAEPRGCES